MIPDDPRTLREPIAFVGEGFVPMASAAVPIWDQGFLHGVTLTERLRTFRHQPWLVAEHLDRLRLGLRLAHLPPPAPLVEIDWILETLLQHNATFLEADAELAVGIAVTGGDSESMGPFGFRSYRDSGPPRLASRLIVQAVRLPVESWKEVYLTGLGLFVSEVQEISGASIPRSLKSRSRLHYWLAEQDPRHQPFRSCPLLLDSLGRVSETPTATIALYQARTQELVVPAPESILSGITFHYASRFLPQLGLHLVRRHVSLAELQAADEVFWFNTPQVLLPVVQVGDRPIADGKPGAIYQQWLTLLETDLRSSLR